MGWSIGYDTKWKRDIGYGVPAFCDYPDCRAEINRGLTFVCGGEPYGGEHGCGLYFCAEHLQLSLRWPQLCERCKHNAISVFTVRAFDPKPEHPAWIQHKFTDPTWAGWREEAWTNPARMIEMIKLVAQMPPVFPLNEHR